MWLLGLFALASRDTDGCLLAFWLPSRRGPGSAPRSGACVASRSQGTRLVDLLVCWMAKTDKELKWKTSNFSIGVLCLKRLAHVWPGWVRVGGGGGTSTGCWGLESQPF